jgi:CRP-like cAMP-binding protein/CheY-like chemotaxis protein
MKKSILIIEDTPDVRKNTAELLKIAGYNTFTASNGKSGLKAAIKNKPDIILCDIVMPELDGYGVLRALENIPEMTGIPFVFITGNSKKTDFRKGMDLGADDYLTKPFSGDDLLRIVDARLKKNKKIKSFNNPSEVSDIPVKNNKSEQGLPVLLDHRTTKKIRKNDLLFSEGDCPFYLYFIASGKIKTFKSNEWGKEYIMDIYKEGEFFGYGVLIEDSNHKETAIAIENSEVMQIPKQEFLDLLHSNNEVAMKFMKLISSNASKAADKLLKLAYDSARKRVAEAIIFVSKKYEIEGKNELTFTILRENISALCGISPESVSRTLADFKEENLIEARSGSIKIIDLKKLEGIKN